MKLLGDLLDSAANSFSARAKVVIALRTAAVEAELTARSYSPRLGIYRRGMSAANFLLSVSAWVEKKNLSPRQKEAVREVLREWAPDVYLELSGGQGKLF